MLSHTTRIWNGNLHYSPSKVCNHENQNLYADPNHGYLPRIQTLSTLQILPIAVARQVQIFQSLHGSKDFLRYAVSTAFRAWSNRERNNWLSMWLSMYTTMCSVSMDKWKYQGKHLGKLQVLYMELKGHKPTKFFFHSKSYSFDVAKSWNHAGKHPWCPRGLENFPRGGRQSSNDQAFLTRNICTHTVRTSWEFHMQNGMNEPIKKSE